MVTGVVIPLIPLNFCLIPLNCSCWSLLLYIFSELLKIVCPSEFNQITIRGFQTIVYYHYHYKNLRLLHISWCGILSFVCKGFVSVMEFFYTPSGHFAILLGRNWHLNPQSDMFLSHWFFHNDHGHAKKVHYHDNYLNFSSGVSSVFFTYVTKPLNYTSFRVNPSSKRNWWWFKLYTLHLHRT